MLAEHSIGTPDHGSGSPGDAYPTPSVQRHLSLDSHGSSLSVGVVTTQGTEQLTSMTVTSANVRCVGMPSQCRPTQLMLRPRVCRARWYYNRGATMSS